MSGRNGQVSRFYCILNILEASNYGLTADQIWERVKEAGHKASKRTIYRDIEALQQSGFPLSNPNDSVQEGAQKWKLERHAKITDNFILNSKELLALFLARGVLTPLKDTPFYSDLESIFKKIETRIDGKARKHLTELMEDFHFDPLPKWGLGLDSDTVETIRAATAEKQVLKVTYSSVNGRDKRERKLGPHFLYFAKGSIYLIAEDLEDKTVKLWSVARMSDAKFLEEVYKKPTVNPEEYFKSAFGVFIGGKSQTVRLEFAPVIAPFVKERGWHPTQKIISKGNGSILFEMEVSLTSEVVQWVLGFGPNCRVIEPKELKDKLIEHSRALISMYEQIRKVA